MIFLARVQSPLAALGKLAVKAFARMGQKTAPQKSKGIKNGSKARRTGFGTSVAFLTNVDKFFNAHRIYLDCQ